MKRLLGFLRDTEPVRLYLYGLGAPLLALLVAYGVVEATYVPLWLAAGAAVLGVPAVEAARSAVDAPATRRTRKAAKHGGGARA